MKNPMEVFDVAGGLFIATENGIFKYDSSRNCFREVEICDKDGAVMQRIGTVHDKPGQQGGN